MKYGNSLKLDINNWDLSVDAFGNLACVYDDAAVCQDVSSALRLFTNDSYYEPDKGIPYLQIAFINDPLAALIRTEVVNCAKSVNGVLDAVLEDCVINATERTIKLALSCQTLNHNIYNVDVFTKPEAS